MADNDPLNTYTCCTCGGVFEKGWSDEEAEAELNAKFGVPQEDCVIVCDDCFKAMGFGKQ